VANDGTATVRALKLEIQSLENETPKRHISRFKRVKEGFKRFEEELKKPKNEIGESRAHDSKKRPPKRFELEELKKLENETPKRHLSDFNKVREKNLAHLKLITSIDDFKVREKFGQFFGRLHRAGLNPNLEYKAEHIDRLMDLLFFFNVFLKYERLSTGEHNLLQDFYQSLLEQLKKCIWWFGEQGTEDDLDLLHEIKTKSVDGIKTDINKAQRQIIERCLKDLGEFYGLNSTVLLKSIEVTIENCQNLVHPSLQHLFDAKYPSEVISPLRESKKLLEKRGSSEAVQKWLITSVKNFKGDTPKQALLKGRVLQVLYHLRKIEERVYN
jgi:hypothetical protein